eukprot:2379352-Rhodomonas_salina.2
MASAIMMYVMSLCFLSRRLAYASSPDSMFIARSRSAREQAVLRTAIATAAAVEEDMVRPGKLHHR